MPPPPSRKFAYDFQVIGPATADLTVEAFICLQCGTAKKLYPIVIGLPASIPDRVRVIVRPWVLYTHVNGLLAAKAVFAFAKQDPSKFVDFVGHVFANQELFSKAVADVKSQSEIKAVFASLAEGFGADRARFELDIDSDEVLLMVKESQCHGIVHSVWSMPTFVVNGTEVTALGSRTATAEDWLKYFKGLLARQVTSPSSPHTKPALPHSKL